MACDTTTITMEVVLPPSRISIMVFPISTFGYFHATPFRNHWRITRRHPMEYIDSWTLLAASIILWRSLLLDMNSVRCGIMTRRRMVLLLIGNHLLLLLMAIRISLKIRSIQRRGEQSASNCKRERRRWIGVLDSTCPVPNLVFHLQMTILLRVFLPVVHLSWCHPMLRAVEYPIIQVEAQ